MSTIKSLIKRGYDDFNIRRMFEDFDEPFFDNFWLKPFDGSNFKFAPKVDITEDDKNLYVSAEIPGVAKDDINVTMNENLLTLSGEKKREEKEERKNYYRLERSMGAFTRTFNVPVPVKADFINAEFKDGILKITLPKIDEVKKLEKHIEIK